MDNKQDCFKDHTTVSLATSPVHNQNRKGIDNMDLQFSFVDKLIRTVTVHLYAYTIFI